MLQFLSFLGGDANEKVRLQLLSFFNLIAFKVCLNMDAVLLQTTFQFAFV